MASARELLGEFVAGPLRVWSFNLEDPMDELERRTIAAMLRHNVTAAEIGDRLFIDSGCDRGLCTAVQVREAVMINRPEVAGIEDELARNRIDVMQVDPFVTSHRVRENDNGAIDRVAREWAGIARRCACAIELVHHIRKTGGAEATTEDGRGAGALLAVARSGRVLNKMTEEQRIKAGVENDPATFFSITRDKANLAPPGKRVWQRITPVDLGQGDVVGVAEPWEWPGDFDGVTRADLLRVQRRIQDEPLLRYSFTGHHRRLGRRHRRRSTGPRR